MFHAKEDPKERRRDFFLRTAKDFCNEKKSSDNRSRKENTKPETESATFFRSIKLCADDKLFLITEDTNLKVQNQKTTVDSLEHSAVSDTLHFYFRGCNIGSDRWRRALEVFCVSVQNLVFIKINCFWQLKLQSKKKTRTFENRSRNIRPNKSRNETCSSKANKKNKIYNCTTQSSRQRPQGQKMIWSLDSVGLN